MIIGIIDSQKTDNFASQWVYIYDQEFEDGDYDFLVSTNMSSDISEGIYYLQQYYPANTYPKGTIVAIEDLGGSHFYWYFEAQ